ncbi:hypothetical protein NPIL_540891 [Nephila pilipes]|uniref:Uncharacterized protein n=1 Tax=Nephila pilipes TaxID=299642 RepID=A0A8X6U345_NEPPI|nr:hypothetical protein NPIL_540891 [Nephila pilipes]
MNSLKIPTVQKRVFVLKVIFFISKGPIVERRSRIFELTFLSSIMNFLTLCVLWKVVDFNRKRDPRDMMLQILTSSKQCHCSFSNVITDGVQDSLSSPVLLSPHMLFRFILQKGKKILWFPQLGNE